MVYHSCYKDENILNLSPDHGRTYSSLLKSENMAGTDRRFKHSPSQDRHRKMLGKVVRRGEAAQKCMELNTWGIEGNEILYNWCMLQLHSSAIPDVPNQSGKWAASVDFWMSWQNKISFSLLMGIEDPSRIKRSLTSALHANWVLPCLISKR